MNKNLWINEVTKNFLLYKTIKRVDIHTSDTRVFLPYLKIIVLLTHLVCILRKLRD